MRITVVAAAVCLSLIGLSRAGDVEAAVSRPTHIPAQGLGPALESLAKQREFQVVYRSEIVGDLRTPGASGDLTLDDALKQLLRDTGLTFKYLDSETVTIVPNPTGAAPLQDSDAKGPVARTSAQDGPRRDNATTSQPGWLSRFRVAQVDSGAQAEAGPSNPRESVAGSDDAVDPTELGEVVVTGSHIRGQEPVGSHVIVLDRAYIERSGYTTIDDIIKTLPQAAPTTSEDFSIGTPGNFAFGVGVDLRGLGEGTTLVLVNGARQAPSGTFGNFVDLSTIPMAAVERIEVLPDGASAIYGSDAIGGVINIITRKDYRGGETRLRFGSMDGDGEEVQASQLLGTGWSTGNVMLGYQYQKRSNLSALDRRYSSSSDQRRNGGDDFRMTSANPGNIINPFGTEPVFGIPAGQDGTSLTGDDLLPTFNYTDTALTAELLPQDEMHSAFLDFSQKLGSRVELLASARYTRNLIRFTSGNLGTFLVVPNTNPFYVDPPAPYGGIDVVVVDYLLDTDFDFDSEGETSTLDGTLDAVFKLSESWDVRFTNSYSRSRLSVDIQTIDGAALTAALESSDPATAFNPFGDGSNTNPATLAGIQMVQNEKSDSSVWTTGLVADGDLFDLPSGPVRLALGSTFQNEEIKTGQATSRADPLGRDIFSAFVEFALPLVRSDTERRGMNSLELSVAARYEQYEYDERLRADFQRNTLDPKIGLSWRVLPALRFRGSWGTSFKAPLLTQLDTDVFNVNRVTRTSGLDSQSTAPNGRSSWLLRGGLNPDLKEETATTWQAGVDFTPASLSGFSASLTYHEIEYQDRIERGGSPGRIAQILTAEEEAIWYPIITRNPSAEAIAALCNSPEFLGNVTACLTLPTAAIVDIRLRNLAFLRTSGLDLSVSQFIDTSRGAFRATLDATYTVENERQAIPTSPELDVVDTVGNVLSLKGRGRISWEYLGFLANAAINYTPAYDDPIGRPFSNEAPIPRDIDSWTTLDIGAAYRFGAVTGLLNGAELRLNVVNVLDEDPPFVNSARGYDRANADPYGRVISLGFTKNW